MTVRTGETGNQHTGMRFEYRLSMPRVTKEMREFVQDNGGAGLIRELVEREMRKHEQMAAKQ